MFKRRITQSRVVDAVRFLPVLRSPSLSPDRHSTEKAGPLGLSFAGPSAAVVEAVFCVPAAGGISAAFEFVNLSDVGREQTTERNRQLDPHRPSNFTMLAAAGLSLRQLCFARCQWWTDDFVESVVGGRVAPTWRGDAGEERVHRLRQLDKSCSGVRLSAVVTCCSIGVDQVDGSGCREVEMALKMVPTWASASVDWGGGGGGGDRRTGSCRGSSGWDGGRRRRGEFGSFS